MKKNEIHLNWTLVYNPADLIHEIFDFRNGNTTALAFELFKAIDKENMNGEDKPFEFLDKVEKYIKDERKKYLKETSSSGQRKSKSVKTLPIKP